MYKELYNIGQAKYLISTEIATHQPFCQKLHPKKATNV